MCFSPFNKICHWGPLTALGIIKVITAMTIHCSNMWWPYSSFGGFCNVACFMSLSGLTLYNFLSSMFYGPGHLPIHWKPYKDEDREFLQWCTVCEGYKAPRSHHCRKCDKCILKMDHHCPWINNCVGWGNHGHFTAFLLFSVLGCAQASVILACSLSRGLYRIRYLHYVITADEPIVYLNIYTLVIGIFALGLSVGVVLAVGMLLFFQVRAIIRNRTGIEDWILEKANHRRTNSSEKFIYPYDVGFWNNVRQVVNWSCQPVGNGIEWPVVEGCDQYTLTKEQIEQKNEKRQRSRLYEIVKSVNGAWFPLQYGFGVCLHPPCTDEPRIRLEKGDKVTVTRWRKYWLFGDKIIPSHIQTDRRIKTRGWFPRKCALEIIEPNLNSSQLNLDHIKNE